MEEIKIIHLSDIHFSEVDFWKGMEEEKRMPLRHGHDPSALMALDKKLKEIEWDKLIISGDLSRVGHSDSFGYVKNWLFGRIIAPNGEEIGLNLSENSEKCFVVPGNHDRFNEHLRQTNLENYQKYFPTISGSNIVETSVNGTKISIQLYDSSYEKGGFAKGYICPSTFRKTSSEKSKLNIVVVHHHLAQAPYHKRKKNEELINIDKFLAFLLSENINGVLFGHTHDRFFENISAKMLKKQIQYKRRLGRILKYILPKFLYTPTIDSVSFKRVKTKNGRYPKFDRYFEYLYLKNILKEGVLGPEKFSEPYYFHEHIKSFSSKYSDNMAKIKKRKIAFSMAPTPCYSDAEKKGFHLLRFTKCDSNDFKCVCDYFKWNGNDFQK